MKHLYRCILWLLLVVLTMVLGAVLMLGAGAVMDLLVSIAGLGEKKDLLHPYFASLSSLTIGVPLVLLISLVLFGLLKEAFMLKSLQVCLGYWVDAFRNLFVSLKAIELVGVLVIPFAASIYFAHHIAVSYDEAITFNFFTIKPFYYCMIFYPYPNNHVLHSLLTNLTEYIPYVSALFAMRIPAILASLLTWLIGYSFLKKYYSARVAIVVVGLASACYLSIYYSFMSRGYAFMVLAFVVCMYASFNIIYKGSRIKDWMFFVVAGVLGCYTIPSFLYPFATLNVLILIYNYRNVKHQIVANAIAGLLVILLYSPIMIVDGVAALTSNQFVQHISRGDILEGLPFFVLAMYSDIVGVPNCFVALMVIPFVLTIFQRDRWHLSLWLVFLIAPIVLILLHAVNPFYRTFLYYNFIVFFLMTVPFKDYLEKVSKYIIIFLILVTQFFSVYIFDSVIRAREGFNTDASEVSDKFFEKGQTIVFPCIASANYEFEANVRGLSDSIHFLNNDKASADTINNCDYVIIEVGRDMTINKKAFYSTSRQNVYKNIE